MLKHGHTKSNKATPEYTCHVNMIRRCLLPDHIAYSDYGGRGIRVCDRWLYGENGKTGFECFLEDMGPRPSSKHSIERLDNNKGYEPSNCQWRTQYDQSRNRRNNIFVICNNKTMVFADAARQLKITHSQTVYWLNKGMNHQDIVNNKLEGNFGRKNRYIEFNGEKKTLAEWADSLGISRPLLHHRLGKLGWSVAQALTTSASPKRGAASLYEKMTPKERSIKAANAANKRWKT